MVDGVLRGLGGRLGEGLALALVLAGTTAVGAEAGPPGAFAGGLLGFGLAGAASWRRRGGAAAEGVVPADPAERLQRALESARDPGLAATSLEEALAALTGTARLVWRGERGWVDSRGQPVPGPDEALAAALVTREGAVGPAELGSEAKRLGAWLRAWGGTAAVPFAHEGRLVGLAAVAAVPRDARAPLAAMRAVGEAALGYGVAVAEVEARDEAAEQVELAAELQRRLVPPGDRLQLGRLEVASRYLPASQCGGDWWAGYALDRGRALVVLGDVTGHGLPSALVAAAAKGACDAAVGEDVEPRMLLEAIDGAVRRVGAGRFHMTCVATLLDPQAGAVHLANAGHNTPYVCRGRRLEALIARGNPLGAGSSPSVGASSSSLGPGDVLVWYTDGLIERRNRSAELFGDRRFQRLLRRALPEMPAASELCERLLDATERFADGQEADDDVTLIVGRV